MNRSDRIGRALAGLRVPIFLARETDIGRSVITIHTANRSAAALIRRCGPAALRAEGIETTCRVILHRPASLNRYKSLETLVRGFGHGPIIYDPTRSISRAESIASCGEKLRQILVDQVSLLYVDAGRRTLFVIVDRQRFPFDPRAMLMARAQFLKQVTEVFRVWQEENRPDFDLAIRVGFDVPGAGKLIPVDRQTASAGASARMKRYFRRGAIATLFGFGAAAPAAAADVTPVEVLPVPVEAFSGAAVAAPNLGVQARGAWLDGDDLDEGGWATLGVKGSVPLGQRLGFQLDAAGGTQEYYGIGGHFFGRDPSFGLLGAIASYESMDDDELARIGAEAELYVDRFTVGGRAGYQSGDVDESLFGRIDLTFYATPNFSVSGGGEFSEDRNLGRVGVEWQPAFSSMPGLSLYADAELGDDDYARVMGGVNFHFGTKGASLIDRDRHYDPKTLVYNPIAGDDDDGYSSPGYSSSD